MRIELEKQSVQALPPITGSADVYGTLGVKTYVNVAGHVTRYGGSIPTEETLRAMQIATQSYVEVHDLRCAIETRIAALTHNEVAYVTASASAALYLSTMAAVSAHYSAHFDSLTSHQIGSCNVLIPSRCRNPYDVAVRQTGVELVEYDEGQFTNAVTEGTVAALYVPNADDPPDALLDEAFVEEVHDRRVAIIVDAAARVPPAATLWAHTQRGADAVLFSGGKGLFGPQSTGLILGQERLLQWIEPVLFPQHGFGRMLKVGREEMVGLLAAIEQLLTADEAARREWCEDQVEAIRGEFAADPRVHVSRGFPNIAGQPLPFAHFRVGADWTTAAEIARALRLHTPGVLVGAVPWGSDFTDGFMVNTLTLREQDGPVVIKAIRDVLDQLERRHAQASRR